MIPAVAARAEREIVAHLRERGATAPAAAVPLPELRGVARRRLERLVDATVVRPADGGFYLDEEMYASYRTDRRTALLAAGFAALALAAGVWLAQRA